MAHDGTNTLAVLHVVGQRSATVEAYSNAPSGGTHMDSPNMDVIMEIEPRDELHRGPNAISVKGHVLLSRSQPPTG